MADGRPEIMTVTQLAEYLQCNKSTIYRLIKKGQIPAFKIGADWRFKRDLIEEWMRQQHQKSSSRGE